MQMVNVLLTQQAEQQSTI